MIRLATPADLPAVHAVELSAGTVFAGTHMDFAANHAPNHPADLLTAIRRRLMWVAVTDATPIGFLFAEPCNEGLYLRELAVAAPSQQQGHGAALMAIGIAAARERRDPLVMLTTDRTLPWNAPFYARLGFTIAEGDAIPREAQRRLAGQYAMGFSPAHRCAMVMDLR
ncbi:MAG: GNAT family N-acetyltransferase [Sandarakinorhabdus sp.]|nr:GNAT family N-acetyltransferase [Sandarakinorhabdus sp.]